MKKTLVRAAAAVAALTAAVPVVAAAPFAGAAPAAWSGGPVTVRVELDLPNYNSDGPRVFERTNVTPGPGFELTPEDEIANPSNWCGSVTVDIDPDAGTVTVATAQIPDEGPVEGPALQAGGSSRALAAVDADPGMTWDACNFETAEVTITGADLPGLHVVSDGLWEEARPPSLRGLRALTPNSMNLVEVGSSVEAGALIRWEADPVESDYYLVEGGSAVFAYEQQAPSTTTTLPGTTTTTVAAPTTTLAARPARAVPAQPRYTG